MVKNLIITNQTKISEVIFDNPYLLLMLEHFGIDLALQEKTIEGLCNLHNININLFISIINLYNRKGIITIDGNDEENANVLIEYLKRSHTYYIDEMYPRIYRYISQLKGGGEYKEVELLDNFFIGYFNQVVKHLEYENDKVFPYILNLLDNGNLKIDNGFQIKEYEDHHDSIEVELIDLKNLLIKHLPQHYDQQIRRKMLFRLHELELDLSIHTQIEDLILVPIVEKLELRYK